MKTLSTAARVRTTRLGAPVRAVLTAMEAGSAARRALYQSRRWRTVSAAFLRRNARCATPGCGNRATIVDHREGHQHANWRARFWDASLWQPLCIGCHAAKSASERAAWRSSGEGLPSPGTPKPKGVRKASATSRPTASGLRDSAQPDI